MIPLPSILLLIVPSALHVGPLRLPVFGVVAALGLMAALTLSQVTARLARLDARAVWDAVLAMVLAALVFSRALLVAGSVRSFVAAPLAVLALPSLNDTGVLLTAVFLVAYLRWKRLPLLGFLDAMAPCAALLWAFLSVGGLLEGTRDGMPVGAALHGTLRVQPVEFYTLVAAMVLCGVLIRVLARSSKRSLPAGRTLAAGLALAGASIFLLDFLRLPSALYAAAMLDPVQWLGLAMIVVGASMTIAMPTNAPKECAHAL